MAKRKKTFPARCRSEDQTDATDHNIDQDDASEQNEAGVAQNQQQEAPNETIELRDADVISGINGEAQRHPGNVQYLHDLNALLESYQNANTSEQKTKIIDQIIHGVHRRGGRFVKYDESGRLSLLPCEGKSGYREKVRKALGHPKKKKPNDAKKKPRNPKRKNRINTAELLRKHERIDEQMRELSRPRSKRPKKAAKQPSVQPTLDQESANDGSSDENFAPTTPVLAPAVISGAIDGGNAPDALDFLLMTPNGNDPTPSSMRATVTPSTTSSIRSEARPYEQQVAHGPAPPFLPQEDDHQQSASITATQEPAETNQDADADEFEPIPYTPGDPLDILLDQDMIELLRELCWVWPDDERF